MVHHINDPVAGRLRQIDLIIDPGEHIIEVTGHLRIGGYLTIARLPLVEMRGRDFHIGSKLFAGYSHNVQHIVEWIDAVHISVG
ncbi:hypothetical protein D3C85_1501760 [compost metagenome]